VATNSWLRGILALCLTATVAGLMPQQVSAATPEPIISQFSIAPSALPSTGGLVQVTATVTSAGGCLFYVRSYAAKFGKSTKISANTCQYTFNAPANTSATTMYVAVTLFASNLNHFSADALQQGTISVAPDISSVTSMPTTSTTFPQTSGNAIPVPSDPDSLLVAGPNIWVASCTANTVTEIRVSTRQVVQEINSPQYGLVCPESLALVGDDIWVADYSNNSITVISASTGALVQTLSGPGIEDPNGITVTDADVWITSDENGLSEFQPSGAFVGRVHGGPVSLPPLGVASTGTKIWVLTFGERGLAEYNAQSGVYLRSSQEALEAGYVSYHGGLFWVSESYGNDPLEEFSASTGARVRVLANAYSGGPLLFDGSALFAVCRVQSVCEFSGAGKFVKTLIRVRGHQPTEAFGAIVLDGNNLWVANDVGRSVDVLRLH